MRRVRVIVTGRVQGVGFRDWTERQALSRNLFGWVRNRADGSVEALFTGDAADVAEMLDTLWDGPRAGQVKGVEVFDTDEEAREFRILPSA
jgi:acylphosphatase